MSATISKKHTKVKIIDPKSTIKNANFAEQKGLFDTFWSYFPIGKLFKGSDKKNNKPKPQHVIPRDKNEITYYKYYEGFTDPEEMYVYYRNLFNSIVTAHKEQKFHECLKLISEYKTESSSTMFYKFINLISLERQGKILHQDATILKLSIKYTLCKEKTTVL